MLLNLLPYRISAEDLQQSFELRDGDRVVLLGNSLFERELEVGYIELALTTRWPDKNIIFRNLGWTGDTVFGVARGYFTTPPDAYGHLIDQLTHAEPTVVFIAYGAIEAYEGENGISRFSEGMNSLLDKIDELGAEAVLLSPIPKFNTELTESIANEHNQTLKVYTNTISDIAREREMRFVDLFNPFMNREDYHQLTHNGIHLNETGYYVLAKSLESGLNLTPRAWHVHIDQEDGLQQTNGAAISNIEIANEQIRFTGLDDRLPLPLPSITTESDRSLTITGLEEGRYTLTVDGGHVKTATASEWAEGVALTYGTYFRQADRLRNRIVRKNTHFFNQYRPQNRTYITGFRSYEQGQNVRELHQLDQLIEREEREISRLRQPDKNVYRLVRSRL